MSHRRLFLAILSVLLLTVSAVAANNTLTRWSAIGGDQKLVSPGDIFQLGLFAVADNTKWFLGIWFTVSPAAVIWVANRDRPLNASSSGFLALSGQGELVLLDAASNNETVWSSNSSSSAAAVAQLDDSGNLVLADDAGAVLFEFQFTDTADEVSYMYHADVGSPPSRLVLNESGVVQRMVWDRAGGVWNVFSSAPRDQCDSYGLCGPFGVCNVVDAMVCGCIRGFRQRSPVEWRMRNASGRCSRRTPLRCGPSGDDSNGLYALRGVKLPETHGSSVDSGASLDECRRRCLSNCSCTAYAASDIRGGGGGGGSGCIQWFGELMDTRFVDGGQDLFVRLAMSDLAIMFDDIMRGECPTYHFETIRAATGGFHPKNEIGRGGFGIVYKGQMLDGHEIAVKKLSANNRAQGLKEFKNEVDLIAKLQHRNLVRLLGCCIHCSDRILVYEYMSNKSLDNFIFDMSRRATLSWKTRMDIILGVARGLLYLHQDSRHNMIHRDLKAANILLNGEMVAKISDFGIAKLFSNIGENQDSTITERIVGTYGYMAPEYAMDGMVSFMQDVYSFGVLLLEIVSGRRNQRNFNLIAHAWKLFEENKSLELLDPAVRGCSPTELEQAATCIQVGLLCMQDSPSKRPQMADVIPMLSHQRVPGQPLRPVVCTVSTSADLLDVWEDTSGNNELTITDFEGR